MEFAELKIVRYQFSLGPSSSFLGSSDPHDLLDLPNSLLVEVKGVEQIIEPRLILSSDQCPSFG